MMACLRRNLGIQRGTSVGWQLGFAPRRNVANSGFIRTCTGIGLSTRCLYPLFGGKPTHDVVLSVLRDWVKVTEGGP